MTKDEFVKNANRKWIGAMRAVCKMSVRVKGPGKAYERNELGEWENDLLGIETHFFSNLNNAVLFIKGELDSLQDRVHSVLVERLPLNQGKGDLPLKWWLSDALGNCIDEAVCSPYLRNSKNELGRYWGRAPEQIRFKKGDIVEVIRYDRVHDLYVGTLAIIQSTPNTIEEEWEYFNGKQQEEGEYPFNSKGNYPSMDYFHDYTDDCYGVLTGCYGDKIMPGEIVKPTLPVPPEAEQELRDYAASHAAWLRAMKNPALTPEELKEMRKKYLSSKALLKE